MKSDERKPQEQPQLTPLMTQNGGTGMMMNPAQMYPGGYQMPVGYPSAPATPSGMAPCGPPPAMMYPNAPTTPALMQPGPYPHHGYASGSSTPVSSNARSPARKRKQMGVDNASSWLGQQHPHLAPGTPGPGSPYGSRAPSVMSYAGMSTMTGFNDDAISVMSGTTNLVELQPAASHQTENIDPARMRAMQEEVKNLALRLITDQAIPAASALVDLLKISFPERFPDEVMHLLISKTLEILVRMPGLQIDQVRAYELLNKLYNILHQLSCISSKCRDEICQVAHAAGVFDAVMYMTCTALEMVEPQQNQRPFLFIRSLAFLTQLIRDEHRSEFAKRIMALFATNKQIFSLLFRRMVNTQFPTAVEFVCRLLRQGDRRAFREKITELKVQMLLDGTVQHPGVLKRLMRKSGKSDISNLLRIVDLLVRNDPKQTAHEKEIQKWFINQNLFVYLNDCLNMNDPKLTEISLQIFATLSGSPHIREDVAPHIAFLMVGDQCVRQTERKLQDAIIFTLSTLSAKRVPLQTMLAGTMALNYACHLIKNYANAVNIDDKTKDSLLEEALNVCLHQIRVELPPELATQRWTDGTDQSKLTTLFFDSAFVACLLNVIVSGLSEKLKTIAVQVIVAGLSLPLPGASRFAPLLFNAFDDKKHYNVVAAIFNAVSAVMMTGKSTSEVGAAFVRSAADLLVFFVEEQPGQMVQPLSSLTLYAKSNSNHFPLNILFCFDNDERVVVKLLQVCKKLVEDSELQQAWAQYREQFSSLSNSGNYEISQPATAIYGMLGMEGDNDYAMAFANSFR